MSTMKDYMMWLDDNGVIDWRPTIGVLRIPTGINIYDEELVERWKNDSSWHSPNLDEDDMIDDDDDDDDNDLMDDDDDELGDSHINPQYFLPQDSAAQYHLDFIGEIL